MLSGALVMLDPCCLVKAGLGVHHGALAVAEDLVKAILGVILNAAGHLLRDRLPLGPELEVERKQLRVLLGAPRALAATRSQYVHVPAAQLERTPCAFKVHAGKVRPLLYAVLLDERKQPRVLLGRPAGLGRHPLALSRRHRAVLRRSRALHRRHSSQLSASCFSFLVCKRLLPRFFFSPEPLSVTTASPVTYPRSAQAYMRMRVRLCSSRGLFASRSR
mmetsp:Transcript_3512/g.9658  ORF Transcript_3512/g.9658 Transcript_3512/m.9658 type:complete len:219 (-) Transcript_3512:65-721(-)